MAHGNRNRRVLVLLASAVILIGAGWWYFVSDGGAAAQQKLQQALGEARDAYPGVIAAAESAVAEGKAESVRPALLKVPEEIREWEWGFLTARTMTTGSTAFAVPTVQEAIDISVSADGKRVYVLTPATIHTVSAAGAVKKDRPLDTKPFVSIETITGREAVAGLTEDGWVYFFAENNLAPLGQGQPQQATVSAMAWNTAMQDLLIAGAEGGSLWNPGVNEVRHLIALPGGAAASAAAASGRFFALGSADGMVSSHASHDAEMYWIHKVADGPIARIAISEAAGVLAAVSASGEILLYDLLAGEVHGGIGFEAGNGAADVRFTSNGKRLLVAEMGGDVSVWDWNTQTTMLRIPVHETPLRELVLSTDDLLLAVLDDQGAIALWSIAEYKK